MKKITLLAVVILLTAMTSQKVKAQAFEEGIKVVSIGYGFPNLVGSLFNLYESYNDYNASSLGPIYFKGEYAVSDAIGVGLSIGYSSTTVEYSYAGINDQGQPVNWLNTWKYSSLGILARVNWHFGDSDKFDPYWGIGMGYRTANFEFTSENPDDITTDLSTPIPFGFESTVGARYYFTDNFGAYAELGFAKSPFQIGISLKF